MRHCRAHERAEAGCRCQTAREDQTHTSARLCQSYGQSNRSQALALADVLAQRVYWQLVADVEEINTDHRMSITGAKFLGASIREQVAAAKRTIEAAGAEIGAAVGEINEAAVAAGKFAKGLRAEADELKAELGQFTNGGGSDDEHVTPAPELKGPY